MQCNSPLDTGLQLFIFFLYAPKDIISIISMSSKVEIGTQVFRSNSATYSHMIQNNNSNNDKYIK